VQRLEERRSESAGIAVESFQAADRTLSMHRAFVGNVAVFSNSLLALQRILDTQAGRAKSLTAAPDFQLLRPLFGSADQREDVLAYASEAFLQNQFGWAQFVKQRRRAEALALLKGLQYSALLSRLESDRPAPDLLSLLSRAGITENDSRLADARFA